MKTLVLKATSNSVTFQTEEKPPGSGSPCFFLKQKMAEALRLDEEFSCSQIPENKGQEVTDDTSACSDNVKTQQLFKKSLG